MLTLEQKTPISRWITIAMIGIIAFGLLTFWINMGNPKLNATLLAAMDVTALPTPTLVTNEAGYSASIDFYPPDPVPSGTTMTFTGTLYLNGQVVPGARVQIDIANTRGVLKTVKAGETGADGSAVTTYNIARIFGEFPVKITASFFSGDNLLIKATNNFTPTR